MSNDKMISPAEIEAAMASAVEAMRNDCADRITALSADAKNERKALSIENGMYSFCLNAGFLSYPSRDRTSVIRAKCNRLPRFLGRFPKLAEAFEKADDDEKLRLSAAFYSIVWMTDQPLPQYIREYEQAKESGDVRSQFEQQIKLKTVIAVIRKWIELAEGFGYVGLAEVPDGR